MLNTLSGERALRLIIFSGWRLQSKNLLAKKFYETLPNEKEENFELFNERLV